MLKDPLKCKVHFPERLLTALQKLDVERLMSLVWASKKSWINILLLNYTKGSDLLSFNLRPSHRSAVNQMKGGALPQVAVVKRQISLLKSGTKFMLGLIFFDPLTFGFTITVPKKIRRMRIFLSKCKHQQGLISNHLYGKKSWQFWTINRQKILGVLKKKSFCWVLPIFVGTLFKVDENLQSWTKHRQ